jgi:hypothetical protein
MWSKRMVAFLRGKGKILWDVTVDRLCPANELPCVVG